MPEVLSRILKPIVDFWKGLDKSQRIRLYITSGIVIVAVGLGLFLLTRPSYTTVIDSASAEDVGEIQKVLSEKGIKYKLTDDKSGIIVNVKDSDAAHMELSVAGFPKNGLNFADALGSIKITTTESDKKHIWQELDEAKIARQLKLLKNVKDASVRIALPEKTLLIESNDSDDVKASVVITKNGEITPAQAQSMVNLVATGVVGLNPENITIVDENQNPLNTDSDDEITKTATQYDMKLRVKSELEKNLRNVLNDQQFAGYDSAKVVVNPYLDFDALATDTKEIKNPEGMDTGAPVSTHSKTEDLKNGTTGNTPAGVDSNPGNTVTYPMGGTNAESYKSSDDTVNYDYDVTSKKGVKALGQPIPERTTAAITLLYGNRVPDDSNLTDAMITEIRSLASAAIGVPVENIVVTKLKVQAPTQVVPTTAEMIRSLVSTYGLPALLILMVIVLVIVAMPKRSKKQQLQPVLAGIDESLQATKFNISDIKQEPVPEIDTEERSEVKKQLEKFVKQKPDAVAQLLRNWLTDDYE